MALMGEPLSGPGWALYQGDALTVLRGMEEGSVNCCVTSPPYWGLRRYLPEESAERQYELGSEKGLDCLGWATGEKCGECYVCHLVEVFREVRRVLHESGVAFLNLGDSYAGSGKGGQSEEKRSKNSQPIYGNKNNVPSGLKPKNLCGVPWRIALALQADGWWLRSEITWCKGNPMPESVTDRPTKATEKVFLLTKASVYWWDAYAVRERGSDDSHGGGNGSQGRKTNRLYGDAAHLGLVDAQPAGEGGRNLRNWWLVNTEAFHGAHFATFPRALVRPMIRAGCPPLTCSACSKPWRRVMKRTKEPDASVKGSHFDKGKTGGRDGGDRTQPGQRYAKKALGWSPTCSCDAPTVPGTVLDPFAGAGTSLLVAIEEGRNAVGIELNPDYCCMAEQRLQTARRVLPFAADEGNCQPETKG